MPVTEGKYQCRLCDDIFEAKSDDFYKCKCGKSEIKPSEYSYTYKNGNRINEIKSITYYLEEEFIKLPDDIQRIYDEIKSIKQATGYKYYLYEMTRNGKNKEKYIMQISISHKVGINRWNSEQNEISLTLNLRKGEYQGDEITRNRLKRFLDMMKKIESGEFDISKRSELIEMAENEGIYYSKESTDEYNYTFHI